MLANQNEYNSVGGGYGYGGFGGFGGIAPIGLIGLNRLFDRDGHKDDCGDGNSNVKNLAILQAISNAKDTTVAEGRALTAAIASNREASAAQAYASAIQASNNTQAIKDQAQAFAVVADARFDALALAGVNQTAAILARINEVETQGLRDQLFLERRGRDLDTIKIENNNTTTQIQGQIQAQAQAQAQRDFDNTRRWDALFSQVAKSSQDIINVGGLMAGVAQSANPVNVKS